MDTRTPEDRDRIRTALFVDFDNVFISLQSINREAARRFATDPSRWVRWFMDGRHLDDQERGESRRPPRAILVRRCYITPQLHGKYRAQYTRAAFSVVDCPPLTSRGKNSADIYMVLDVVELLEHRTRFDEFIILSSDSDFTPVLLRLRTHDRRTTILANPQTAAAYSLAADIAVPMEQFIEEALEVSLEEADGTGLVGRGEPPAPDDPEILRRYDPIVREVAEVVHRRVQETGVLEGGQLSQICQRYPEFGPSWWFGRGTAHALAADICTLVPGLSLEGPERRFRFMAAGNSDGLSAAETLGAFRDRLMTTVQAELEAAGGPVLLSRIGQVLHERFGDRIDISGWAGVGSLKALVGSGAGYQVALLETDPEYVCDTERDTAVLRGEVSALPGVGDRLAGVAPDMAAIIDQVAAVTGAPRLAPEDYAIIFRNIAAAVAAQGTFQLSETSRCVRDLCTRGHHAISRRYINFVLLGLTYQDFDFAAPDLTPAQLALAFAQNLLNLCRNAQWTLSPEEEAQVQAWLVAPVAEDPVPEANPALCALDAPAQRAPVDDGVA